VKFDGWRIQLHKDGNARSSRGTIFTPHRKSHERTDGMSDPFNAGPRRTVMARARLRSNGWRSPAEGCVQEPDGYEAMRKPVNNERQFADERCQPQWNHPLLIEGQQHQCCAAKPMASQIVIGTDPLTDDPLCALLDQ
jgi:hypothetical protein